MANKYFFEKKATSGKYLWSDDDGGGGANSNWSSTESPTYTATTKPADGDNYTFTPGTTCTYDVDMSAWPNGIGNGVISGGVTPATLVCQLTNPSTNWLKIKTGCTLAGTTSTNRGRLLVNSDGVWGNTGVLPYGIKFVIDEQGTGNVDSSNLDIQVCRTIETYKSVETYGTKITVSAVSAANDTLTIDDGAGVFVNTTPVKIRSSGTLPGGISSGMVYYVYNRTLVSGTTYTIQLREYSSASVGILNITSTGSGTIEIYNGHSNLATGQMNVLTDVRSDTPWSTVANFNAVVLESPYLSSPYYDVQRTSLSNIAETTITLADNVDSVQRPGALICLGSSNVQILSNSTSTSHIMIDWKSSTFTGSRVDMCFRNTACAATGMTVYSQGTNGGVSHILNSLFVNCFYGLNTGSGHSGTWTFNGCFFGLYIGSGHSGTWTFNGCSYGVYTGSGHSGTWTFNGCYISIHSGSGHSGTWTFNGCSYGVYIGSGHSGTWTFNGCSTSIYTGSGHSGTWTFNGCSISIHSGSGHSGTWTFNGCYTSIHSGSGHSGTWTFNGCSYGVYTGSYGFVSAIFIGCFIDLMSVTQITLNNSSFGTGIENYQYLFPYRPDNSYNESINHSTTPNALKIWNNGGIVTSQTSSPPTGYTTYYRHTGELLANPTFRQYRVTVDPNQTLIVTGLIRNTSGVDLSAVPPKLQIIDVFNDPLSIVGATALVSCSLPVSNGTNTTWQDVAVSWTNTAAYPRIVYVRVISYAASGDVDECLYSPGITAQVSAIYTKLPTNYIMGSSVLTAKDDEIDAIKTVIDTNLDTTISSRLAPAGTLATVTNLTNAPSNGDFTGTMKTSLNVATPAVTVSDKTGFSLSVAGILAIWHQLLADIVTASTIGKKIKDWVLGTDSKALISIDAQDLSGTLDVNAKKLNGATPNNLAAGAAMTLADDAITSAKFDETSAFPLKAADTGATQVARTGADSDTLETLSDQIDGVQTTVDAIAANSGKIVYGSVISTSGVKKTINAGSAIGFVTDEKL